MKSSNTMVRNLIVVVAILIVAFVIVLNSGMVADQVVGWVNTNAKDPSAPDVLYRTARWCDIMGNDDKAAQLYWMLYQQYPERADLCAPALYYTAYDKANGTYILGIKKQALQYLTILLSQYSGQTDWCTKGKQLQDEVTYAH
ncbi:MAG TPA: hypothetical protein VJ873_02315 [bacterium]|nr:hypothetical protein [bacterium]